MYLFVKALFTRSLLYNFMVKSILVPRGKALENRETFFEVVYGIKKTNEEVKEQLKIFDCI